jgi:hypothetical protein
MFENWRRGGIETSVGEWKLRGRWVLVCTITKQPVTLDWPD